MKQQAQAFGDLTRKNNELEADKQKYLKIFKDHNLTKLARARPGLIEPRINKGTNEVFRQVEEDSRELDEADDTESERVFDNPE